jgi:hypothetical protein
MSKAARSYEFAMGFVHASEKHKQQFVEPWREVLSNFTVTPYDRQASTSPYRTGRVDRSMRQQIVLKDPETHKAIMTFAAKLVRTILGDPAKEYCKAKPRGYEDAPQKAPTASRLVRYAFGLPGHFRVLVEAVVDMLLFGTSVIETTWCYEEREMPVREVTSELGVETDSYTRLRVPVYDDVKLSVLNVEDFYYDPTQYLIRNMAGVAKRFRMNAQRAQYEVARGLYDKAAVRRAVDELGKGNAHPHPPSFREGIDQPNRPQGVSDFRDMVGYEYWGDVPWEDDQGFSRRVITVLNNVVVRDEAYPLADPYLPFHTFIINPVQGRFYGVSPAEVIRYDQDLADAIKILLAEAIIRQVHPPIAFDPDAEVDVAALKTWRADALIAARGGPAAVGTIQYNANIPNGFALLAQLKDSMQGASGAMGAIQGEDGPDREAATVGANRMQNAMDRPELAGMMLESECLPPVANAILRRYQQFLPDTEALKMRVGEQPEPIWLGDIMGDFDVEFVGSRQLASGAQKMQNYDRLIATATAVPPLMMQIPWDMIGRDLVGEALQLPEVAAKMADPQTMLVNLLLSRAAGGGGQGGPAQNGVPESPEPAGLLPAQAGGSEL